MISTIKTYAVDLTHILFGNVLGVSDGDLVMIAVLACRDAGDHRAVV